MRNSECGIVILSEEERSGTKSKVIPLQGEMSRSDKRVAARLRAPNVRQKRLFNAEGDPSTKSLNAILPPAPLRMTAGGNGNAQTFLTNAMV